MGEESRRKEEGETRGAKRERRRWNKTNNVIKVKKGKEHCLAGRERIRENGEEGMENNGWAKGKCEEDRCKKNEGGKYS
jgi:hypothetical protein